jgi:hypothetical protein
VRVAPAVVFDHIPHGHTGERRSIVNVDLHKKSGGGGGVSESPHSESTARAQREYVLKSAYQLGIRGSVRGLRVLESLEDRGKA